MHRRLWKWSGALETQKKKTVTLWVCRGGQLGKEIGSVFVMWNMTSSSFFVGPFSFGTPLDVTSLKRTSRIGMRPTCHYFDVDVVCLKIESNLTLLSPVGSTLFISSRSILIKLALCLACLVPHRPLHW